MEGASNAIRAALGSQQHRGFAVALVFAGIALGGTGNFLSLFVN